MILAKGAKPLAAALSFEVRTRAEAPSEIELAFAAVIVPSFAKAGRKVGILSILALKGCSSLSTTITFTGGNSDWHDFISKVAFIDCSLSTFQ